MAPLMATALGFILLTANSIIAIHNSWGHDAAATVFVIASYASIVLLFFFLHLFEAAPPGSPARDRAKVAVWALTTLLMTMFASREAALMPLAVGVLVFICLRDVDQVRGGEGGGGINMHGQYYALAKVGFAVLACHTALDTYNTRRDPGSAAFLFVCYTLLVILTGLFVRVFARAHAAKHGLR